MQDIIQSEEEIKPWDRQPEETLKHYQWFQVYLSLGAGRTLSEAWRHSRSKAQKKPKRTAGPTEAWKNACKEYYWKERATAYDVYLREKADEEYTEQLKQLRKRQLNLAEEMLEKVGEMMQFPVAQQQTQTKDGKVVIIQPGKWHFGTVAAMLRASADLTDDKKSVVEVNENINGSVTHNVNQTIELTDGERVERIAGLLDRARARRTRQSAD
jgi:hypothetical protein